MMKGRNYKIKKLISLFSVIVIVILLLCFTVTPVFAGGDQNCERHRGDEGQGSVVQNRTVPGDYYPND